MSSRALTLICSLAFLAACAEEPVAPEGQDAGLIQAAKGGSKGKPGGGNDPGVSFNYTITDLGADISVRDINDDGVLVGRTNDQAAVWFQVGGPPLLLGDPGGAGSWGSKINAAGTKVIGGHWAENVQHGDLWELGGASVTRIPLHPLTGDDEVIPSGINDKGQVVGQSVPNDRSSQRAVLWEPDGSGNMIPRDLGDLPGFPGSWAQAISNAGHAVGRSGIRAVPVRPRAVMWFVEGTNVTAIDLTADSDDSGDNHALDITEPSGGFVQISGYTTIAGQQRPTVWTVDVQTKEVTAVRLEGVAAAWGRAINQNGEVAVTSGVVWTPAQSLVEPLPMLSNKCSSQAWGINNTGTVVGQSSVFKKGGPPQGRCVSHAVVWTKKN